MTDISMEALMITGVVVILTIILKFAGVFSRTSSSRSQDSSERGGSPVPNTSSSSVIASSAASSSSGSSWKYDVFLSFRGEDTRKTFVDHLYSALVQQSVCTYKDDETLPRGDSIGPSLLKAIQESHIALIVFSKNYADSSWCLDELAYILKCKEEKGQIVIPIFYEVDPSDVRKQKGQFGKAFSKHKSVNKDKVESWRKALLDASNIAGWEPKHIANGHEAAGIKIIVGTFLDKLLYVNSDVDENLVGMGSRFKYLESQLQVGSLGVRMIGIWGVGGGGKTTLAFSVYMKIRDHFQGHCFIGNIREESVKHGLQKLQEKVLSEVLKTQVFVASVQEGRYKIQSMLCRRNVLIVLDDVDDLEHLEALAGCHNWFGDGSRIIITTRDEQVLTSHGVDVSPIRLLSDDEAIRLFRRHAYHEDNPVEDYDELSLRVIKYVNGLPLALKIIGSFLYDKDKIDWIDALDKLRKIPNLKVTDQLKISYDGLDHVEKELFLDIACFFRGKNKEKAMEMLDACGFHPRIGVTVLIKKSLITISKYGQFDMHDLVQEMGHHIVRGEHPNNPEKHNRVWRDEDIEDMCAGNATTENHKIEAIQYYIPYKDPAQGFMKLVSNLKKLRFLRVSAYGCNEGPTFLSNELKCMDWDRYPASLFPESFQPRKLVVLKLEDTLQKELWKGIKYMPCLKELELMDAKALVRTPDISGLSCLQRLIIKQCKTLEEIHHSLGNHASLVHVSVSSCNKLASFPTIVQMEKLEILKISDCKALLEIPQIKENLHFNKVSVHQNLPCLKELELRCVDALVRTPDFGGLPCLQKLTLSQCSSLEEIHPSIGSHSSLFYIHVESCPMLTRFPTIVRMEKLKFFTISDCRALLEFPKIKAKMDSLENLELVLVNIEVLPSSVGRYCTNLILLKLDNCSKLKTIEGNLHALKRLEKFKLYGKTQLEKFPKDLFDVKCCLQELCFRVSGNILPPSLPHLLRKLNLSKCKLKDGEIPREIGELSSLKELHLDFNHFSRVDINLSKLTQLKLLTLNYCKMLVELPELPSNLAILEADYCNSLEAIRDDLYSKCKWLCSFTVRSAVGGKRLLESMLQGNAIENHRCMSLILRGLEIPKEFEPRLVRGSRYRLQLPENWFNEYTGFLFCSVFEIRVPRTRSIEISVSHSIRITMGQEEKLVQGGGKMGMGDSQDEQVFWEEDESVDDDTRVGMGDSQDEMLYKERRKKVCNRPTWVGYVSFGSLKSTAWWDQTSTAVEVSIDPLTGNDRTYRKYESFISGVGVRLVSKKNQMKETTTKNSSSEFSDDGDYKCKFKIHHDSKSKLECRFQSGWY